MLGIHDHDSLVSLQKVILAANAFGVSKKESGSDDSADLLIVAPPAIMLLSLIQERDISSHIWYICKVSHPKAHLIPKGIQDILDMNGSSIS